MKRKIISLIAVVFAVSIPSIADDPIDTLVSKLDLDSFGLWVNVLKDDIPIKVGSSMDLSDLSEEQWEQVEYIRSLCKKMVSADEIGDISVTMPGSYHHMGKNYAVVLLPRLATATHAVYRKINIYNTCWLGRDKPYPGEWSHELVVSVVPLFTFEDSEYAIPHSPNLSQDDVAQILRIIRSGDVEYPPRNDEKPCLPIEAARIVSITLSRVIAPQSLITIREVKQPETSSRIDVYEGYLKNEKLVIVKAYGMHIN